MNKKSLLKKLMIFLLGTLFLSLTDKNSALAGPTLLPYPNRTQPYNAWTASPRGDLRTVGMAGATVGLADNLISAMDNPAGLAMTLQYADFKFISDTVSDAAIQSFDIPLRSNGTGIAVPLYPWGFSFSYFTNNFENQDYSVSSSPEDPINMNIVTQEMRLSVARLFYDNRLSLGLSLILIQGSSVLQYTGTPHFASSTLTFSGTIGAQYQVMERLIIGLSLTPPVYYGVGGGAFPSLGLTNYFQPLRSPARIGVGIGWISNRFFRIDLTTFLVGPMPDTALLRDQTIPIGQYTTIQPRLGLAYHWINLKEFSGQVYAGAYFEHSRIQNYPNRVHGTLGLDLNPWIFTVGAAIDRSYQYQNLIIALGIDINKIFQKLEIIPLPHDAPPKKLFPRPDIPSDEGLPRPLVANWQPPKMEKDPMQVSLSIPSKVETKISDFSKTVSEVLSPAPSSPPPQDDLDDDNGDSSPHRRKKTKKKHSKKKRPKKILNEIREEVDSKMPPSPPFMPPPSSTYSSP